MFTRRLTRIDPENWNTNVVYKGETFKGKIINISLNGLLLEFEPPCAVELKDIVELEILPDDANKEQKINMECAIVRIEEGRFGLQFHAIDLDSLMFLKDMVSKSTGDEQKVMEELMHFAAGDDYEAE